MPHVVVLYTANVESKTNMSELCRVLANELLSIRDEDGKQPYPTAGTRVFALSSPHFAVADGLGDYGFIYINLRMAAGRSDAVKKLTGDRLLEQANRYLASALEEFPVGITLQIDQSPGQVFDAKAGSLRKIFAS